MSIYALEQFCSSAVLKRPEQTAGTGLPHVGLNHFLRTLTCCNRMISGEERDAALTRRPRDIRGSRERNRRNMTGSSVEARQQESGGRKGRSASRVFCTPRTRRPILKLAMSDYLQGRYVWRGYSTDSSLVGKVNSERTWGSAVSCIVYRRYLYRRS